MLGKTHLAAGIALGAGVCLHAELPIAAGLICLAGSGLGSLLPDIDHRNSTISKAANPVGVVVNAVAGHRKVFHDPATYALLGVLCAVLKPEWLIYVVPILMGVASHLFLDALNPMGIPILCILHGPTIHLASIHTGSKVDKTIGLLLNIVGRLAAVIWLVKAIFIAI